jgi:hypothetical protein
MFPRLPVIVALVLILAGCGHREPIAIQPAPAPVVVLAPPPPPPVSPINRGLSRAATVWHLRVALNVAALACRGASEATIVSGYNAMLRGRTTVLASAQSALSAEYRARGGDWQDAYDDAMTRLYNFFSQVQARDAFCAAAERTLAAVPAVPADGMEAFAAAELPLLDRPFAPPAAQPAMVYAAAAPIPLPIAPMRAEAVRAPVLTVDVSALGE